MGSRVLAANILHNWLFKYIDLETNCHNFFLILFNFNDKIKYHYPILLSLALSYIRDFHKWENGAFLVSNLKGAICKNRLNKKQKGSSTAQE